MVVNFNEPMTFDLHLSYDTYKNNKINIDFWLSIVQWINGCTVIPVPPFQHVNSVALWRTFHHSTRPRNKNSSCYQWCQLVDSFRQDELSIKTKFYGLNGKSEATRARKTPLPLYRFCTILPFSFMIQFSTTRKNDVFFRIRT